MTPYYADGAVTIYHGDCREVLPTLDLAAVSLVLTDPPYGIALSGSYGTRHARGGRVWNDVAGDREAFDPSPLLRFPRLILWGANYYADRLPPRGSWFVWTKRIVSGHPDRGDAELAWTNVFNGSVRELAVPWDGGDRQRAEREFAFVHPTQKPVALMRLLVQQFTEPGDLVLDPYMGSGPVAQACREERRHYIGVELDESYCATAARRCSQEVLDLGGAA